MTIGATWAAAAGLSLALAAPGAAAGPNPEDERPAGTPKRKARLYTNDDLERVHPLAAQTGVSSVPAVPLGEEPAPSPPEPKSARRGSGPRGPRGEAYWRAEAARVRERLRALDERAAALRARIAERARAPEVFGRRRATSGTGTAASLQASLDALVRRRRLTEDDLEERARRDGALPGWLR